MRLGDEVKSGLNQPNRTEDSQKSRNAITGSVPRTKFSLRFQREAMAAGASADAGIRSSSAGVTVMNRSARHRYAARRGFFVDQPPDMILQLAETRLKFQLQAALRRKVDRDDLFDARGTRRKH